MSNKKNIHGDVGNCLWHWVYNIKETTKHAIVVICKSKIIKSGQPLWNPFNWWSWENYGETHDETKWNILLEPWDLTLFWLVKTHHQPDIHLYSSMIIMPIEMAIFGGWLAAPSGADVRVGKRVACPMQGDVRCGWNLSFFPVSVATSSFH